MADLDAAGPEISDDPYFSPADRNSGGFDATALREPLSVLPTNAPICFKGSDAVSEAMRAMQREHRGCVLITEDGTPRTRLIGIFTERNILMSIIDRGRNPANLPLEEVMVKDPESLGADASVAWVLNKMSVGGFRHVPVVDDEGRPVILVSVRDVVEYLVQAFPSEILNLPPEFGVERYQNRDGA
jgi:CBS domain-containing protein